MADPITGSFVTAGGQVLSGLVGALAGQTANEANIQQAREARQWQEDMYNKYYSPKAMMRQYEDAGLNPYMLGQNSGAVGQSSMPGTSAPTVNPVNPLSGTDAAINTILQQQQLSLESKSVQADFALKLSQAFSEAYKTGGKKGARQLMQVLEPTLANVDFDQGFFAQRTKSEIYNIDMNSLLTDFQYETGKKYTPEQKRLEFSNLAAQTEELFSLIDVQGSQVHLNEEEAKTKASQIAKNFADAFNAQKQGEYYMVSAKQMEIINDMLELQRTDALVDFRYNTGLRKFKLDASNWDEPLKLFTSGIKAQGLQLGIAGNKYIQTANLVSDYVGRLFKVNFGLSENTTNFRNLNPDKPATMFYSGDGYYLNNGVLQKGNW